MYLYIKKIPMIIHQVIVFHLTFNITAFIKPYWPFLSSTAITNLLIIATVPSQ
jgi:hypothetical protein